MPEQNRSVFVVHGRNTKARDAMFAFLRAIKLDPLEWSEAVQATGKPTPYIGDILDAAFSGASAVLVLFTPDDEARLRREWHSSHEPPHETDLTGQARPNVLFEAGMAMGRNEESSILVELGELRPFSDIGGRHVVRLDNSTQRRQDLAHRLRDAGCPVNLDGTDWHSAGDFQAAIVASQFGGTEDSERQSEGSKTPHTSTLLSVEAAALIRRTNHNRPKSIKRWVDNDGRIRIAVGLNDLDEGDDRSAARAHGALEELIEKKLLRVSQDVHGEKDYAISDRGFKWLDANTESESPSALRSTLSEEAWELLRHAVDAYGSIECITNLGRTVIRVKGRAFDTTDARATATWMGAIGELERLSLIEPGRGSLFNVTREGFNLVGSEED